MSDGEYEEQFESSVSPTRSLSPTQELPQPLRRPTSSNGKSKPSYDEYDAADYPERERSNNDLRSASQALGAIGTTKLDPREVTKLKGLSGSAWERKLAELVSTVKGESYSRAPTNASLLIDSTGASALGGRAVNHHDPMTTGATSGSMFSANPPLYTNAAKRQQQADLASNQKLFSIARVSDGVVYGAKAYANKSGGGAGHAIQQKDKVLDKYAMDAEEMRHTITLLKKESHHLKTELQAVHRECDLLDAHLQAQNAALDEAALKKGFLRVGAPDKPRYEKVISNSVNPTTKLSLEEEYLTLQVQQKSLRAQKHQLERQYDELQDEVGSLRPNYEQEQELERETRKRILSELHELQSRMMEEKQKHETEQKLLDQRIHELRHEAGGIQVQLEVQRKALTAATLAYQEELDRKTSMQAKLTAIRKRLAKVGPDA